MDLSLTPSQHEDTTSLASGSTIHSQQPHTSNTDDPMQIGSSNSTYSGHMGSHKLKNAFSKDSLVEEDMDNSSSPFKKKNDDDFSMQDDDLGTQFAMDMSSKPPFECLNAAAQKDLLQPIINFYTKRRNYECMPESGKVVLFDIDLPVKDAFYAAAANDISFTTLWDSREQQLVGMLTVTDLIDILLHYHDQTNVIKELISTNNIRQWRNLQSGRRNRPQKFISVTPEDSMLTSIQMLHENKIHRLPVVQKGSLLHIITHSHLLSYMVHNISLSSPIFKYSLADLGLGTFGKIVTANPENKIMDILLMFREHKVSAIPIVNKEGIVIDVFSRYDIVYLIRAEEDNPDNYALDFTVNDALKMKPKIPVFTCMRTETFEKVLRHLAGTRIHRLVCVDELGHIVGVVSISDIFGFFLKHI